MIGRNVWIVSALMVFATRASAIERIGLSDPQDDPQRIQAVWQKEAVRAFEAKIERIRGELLAKGPEDIRRILGRPSDQDLKTYAFPVAQTRIICLPGLRQVDAQTRSDVHVVKDFAAVKIWYLTDRKNPVAAVIYLNVDKAFPKLTADNLKERLAWDGARLDRLAKVIERRQSGRNRIAVGDWSEPAADRLGYKFRGRLLLCEGRRLGDGKTREIAVYVELQDVSSFVGQTMKVFFDGNHGGDFRKEYKGGLDCELRDELDRLVPESPFAFGGAIPSQEWITLPADGTVKLRASPFGVGRPPETGLAIALPGHFWVIPSRSAHDYFLSGTFTVQPPRDSNNSPNYHVWQGTLTLPRMRIPGTQR
jgi:hypothetical protein